MFYKISYLLLDDIKDHEYKKYNTAAAFQNILPIIQSSILTHECWKKVEYPFVSTKQIRFSFSSFCKIHFRLIFTKALKLTPVCSSLSVSLYMVQVKKQI